MGAEQQAESSGKPARSFGLSHIGVAGGVVAAMVMLQPVKDFFYTREEGKSTEARLQKVEQALVDLSKELREGQDKNADRMVAAIAEQDRRMEQRFSGLETSLNRNIELLFKSQKR